MEPVSDTDINRDTRSLLEVILDSPNPLFSSSDTKEQMLEG